MKKNYLLSAAAAFVLVVTGCSDDLENGNKPATEEDGNKVYMTVNVSTVSQAGAMTKAGGTPSNPNGDGAGWGEDGNGFLEEFDGANEGKVYDINIFLVKYEGTTFRSDPLNFFTSGAAGTDIAGQGWYQSPTGIDPDGGNEPAHDSAGKVTMKVTMNEDLSNAEHTYQVFTVVNAGERLSGITNLGELRERVTVRNLWTGGNSVTSADKFIMTTHKMTGASGIGNSIITLSASNMDETNPAVTTVFVERMAARIDLGYAAILNVDNIRPSSPAYGKGSFQLTGYKVVNQWKGSSYAFKQVSPQVQKNFGDGSSLADALGGSYTTAPTDYKYLGNEVWSMNVLDQPEGSYNYVLDPSISAKKLPVGENDDPWSQFSDSYINYFNPKNQAALNNVAAMDKIPSEAAQSPSYKVSDRTYFPVVYTKENTLDREAQVNGYSTGVIFESEFMPSNDFKVSSYNSTTGAIESVGLGADKTFLLAVHKAADGTLVRTVYEDLPSVAAVAFNLQSGARKNLLSGLMGGWSGMTGNDLPDFAAVKEAINKMSDQNTFESEFKKYLSELVESQTAWSDDLKAKLCYAAFRETQNIKDGGHLPDAYTEPNRFTSEQIADLYQYYDISLYKGGKSYHKFWIRHNDNGNDGLMGVMEFCIVRNNVYQLYVTGVRGLGDPLPYTPGKDTPDKPDETDDVTIDVTIYVKDWVKRTNKDIII